MKKLKTYKISYRAWIPSYRDFDYDTIFIEATSKKAAETEFMKKHLFVTGYEIVEFRGCKFCEASPCECAHIEREIDELMEKE